MVHTIAISTDFLTVAQFAVGYGLSYIIYSESHNLTFHTLSTQPNMIVKHDVYVLMH